MTERLYQGLILLLLAGCAALGWQWYSAEDDVQDALKLRDAAATQLAQEQLTVAQQQSAIATQNSSIAALAAAQAAAEQKVAALTQAKAATERRLKEVLDAAGKVDTSKFVSCDDAMPTVRSILKGVRP